MNVEAIVARSVIGGLSFGEAGSLILVIKFKIKSIKNIPSTITILCLPNVS